MYDKTGLGCIGEMFYPSGDISQKYGQVHCSNYLGCYPSTYCLQDFMDLMTSVGPASVSSVLSASYYCKFGNFREWFIFAKDLKITGLKVLVCYEVQLHTLCCRYPCSDKPSF